MKNTDMLSYTDPRGNSYTFPAYIALGAIDNLSDDDKAKLATTIVNMLPNTEEGKYLALNVLRYRCNVCGEFLNVEHGVCYCSNDD